MTQTNRFLNRFLLAVAGILLLGSGLVVLVLSIPSPIRDAAQGVYDTARTFIADSVTELGEFFNVIPEGIVGGAGLIVAIIVVTIALSVLFTRGGGRTKELVNSSTSDEVDGAVVIEPDGAAAILRDPIMSRPDVVHVSSAGYRAKGNGVLDLRIQLRSGAVIGEVVSKIEDATRSLDRYLGSQIPVIVEFVGGTRARLSSNTRTAAAGSSAPEEASGGSLTGSHSGAEPVSTDREPTRNEPVVAPSEHDAGTATPGASAPLADDVRPVDTSAQYGLDGSAHRQ